MTKSQRFFLCVNLWEQVCKKKGWHPKRDEAKRRDLYAEAFTDPKYLRDIARENRTPPESFSEFQERDFDEAKRHFLSIIKDDDIRPQMEQLGMVRTRLIVSITSEQIAELEALAKKTDSNYSEGAGDRYVFKILEGRFDGKRIENLSDKDLVNLRNTLAARINKLRNVAGLSIHEMKMLAREFCPLIKCYCAKCKKQALIASEEPSAEDVLKAWTEVEN